MCAFCPCDVNFRYSFFSSEFSMKRKMGAKAAIVIGVALAIIMALGIAGILPCINAQTPLLILTLGTIAFLVGGFSLAGCRPRNEILELSEALHRHAHNLETLGQL